jgi:hypothetical protein
MKKTYTGMRPRIRELASRPEGMSADDMPEWPRITLMANAAVMAGEGKIIAVGYRSERRVFLREEDADVYRRALVIIKQQKRQKHRNTSHERVKQKRAALRAAKQASKPAKPEPKKAEAKEVGVTVKHYGKAPWTASTPADYSKAKVTICPSPPEFGMAAKLRGL